MNILNWIKKIWFDEHSHLNRHNYKSKLDFNSCTVTFSPPQNINIQKGEFFIVTPKKEPKWALFQCPCKCGHVITLNLSPKKVPKWRVYLEKDGSPTLYPSIRQINGCLSHFWIKQGKVYWCEDTGKPFIELTKML